LLPFVDWPSAEVTLVYSEPGIRLKNQGAGLVDSNLEPMNAEVFKTNPWSEIAAESWRGLYKEKESPDEVFQFLFQNYPLAGNHDITHLQKAIRELKRIAAWEELASGLPEIF